VRERGDLLADRGDHRRVGVAERVHGDAGEEIEVLRALVIPDVAPLTAHEQRER
jgi:hypothetical protein